MPYNVNVKIWYTLLLVFGWSGQNDQLAKIWQDLENDYSYPILIWLHTENMFPRLPGISQKV